MLEKTAESEFQMPTSALLTPPALHSIRPTTEIEFEIEQIIVGEDCEGLRVRESASASNRPALAPSAM